MQNQLSAINVLSLNCFCLLSISVNRNLQLVISLRLVFKKELESRLKAALDLLASLALNSLLVLLVLLLLRLLCVIRVLLVPLVSLVTLVPLMSLISLVSLVSLGANASKKKKKGSFSLGHHHLSSLPGHW